MPSKNNTKPLNRFKNYISNATKPRTGWGPISAIIVTLAIYVGAQLFAIIPFSFYVGIKGYSESESTNLAENSIFVQFSFLFLVGIFSLYFLYLFLKSRKIKWADIGLKKPSVDNILLAFPAFAIYFVVLLGIYGLIGQFVTSINVDQKQEIGFENANGLIPLIFVFVSLVIIPSVVEEIMVRGFLYGGLVKKFKKIIAALITSAVFGVAHLQLGIGNGALWIAAIDTFILSMFLIYLRERTGNLFAGMTVHAIKNSLAFMALFVFSVS